MKNAMERRKNTAQVDKILLQKIRPLSTKMKKTFSLRRVSFEAHCSQSSEGALELSRAWSVSSRQRNKELKGKVQSSFFLEKKESE